MGAGDTIAGSIRVLKEDTEGNRNIVFGPESSSAVDTDAGLGPEEKLYINTMFDNGVEAPLQAKEKEMTNSRGEPVTWYPGEKIIVQHLSASLEETVNVTAADSFNMEVVRRDLNNGRTYPGPLTEADNEASNVSSSTSDFEDIFEETIPDRQSYRFAGSFEARAAEDS